MAALRQTGSHCGGPRAGQVLAETQIPPKQSPPCLPATGRGILRAFPGKGLGPGHKGSIFSWEAACCWLQAAARGAFTSHPRPQRRWGSLPPAPHAVPRQGQPDTALATPASRRLDLPSPPPPGSPAGARQVRSLPSRCCTNAGQAGTPGTKSVPGQSRARRCAGGAWLHPRASPPWHSWDRAFPARGIPHRAQPGLWAQDVAPLGADAFC